MGEYIYRVTAKRVKTPVGLANVLAYAYKPYAWDDAANTRMRFKSGCVASERMVDCGNHTGRAALVTEAGDVETVFQTDDRATISDSIFDRLPVLYRFDQSLGLEVASVAITGKTWPEFCATVKGTYCPTIDRKEYGPDLIKVFAEAFRTRFSREVYINGTS